MTRDQLRTRIDTMERLHDVLTAFDELSDADLKTDETIDLTVSDRSHDKAPIVFVRNLPRELVQVGLKAIQQELEAQLQPEVTA